MHFSSRTRDCTTCTTGSESTSERSSRTSTSRQATSSAACRSTRKAHDEQRSATGTATLFINDEQVGQQSIKTQPGKFTLAGEGLNVGKDPGGPVSTTAYTAPFALTGGAIREVIIDVSGQAYVDLELDAIGMMSRD